MRKRNLRAGTKFHRDGGFTELLLAIFLALCGLLLIPASLAVSAGAGASDSLLSTARLSEARAGETGNTSVTGSETGIRLHILMSGEEDVIPYSISAEGEKLGSGGRGYYRYEATEK